MKKRKNGIKPISQFVAIVVLTISIFLVVDFGRKAAANYRVQREAERLSQEVEAARRYQSKLLAQRTYAASDLYVEEVARRELKWAKPNEVVTVVFATSEVQRPIAKAGGVQRASGAVTTPEQAWVQLFFGKTFPHNVTP